MENMILKKEMALILELEADGKRGLQSYMTFTDLNRINPFNHYLTPLAPSISNIRLTRVILFCSIVPAITHYGR